MKQLVWLMIACVSLIPVKAQPLVCLSTQKTTSLVFPFAIIHVDRGTPAILVQQVKEAPGILLVKAAEKAFPETNLSVVTNDGSIYTFRVCYEDSPSTWVFHLPVNSSAGLETYANSILDNPPTLSGIRDVAWKMDARITGIYIKNAVAFYQVSISNKTPVDYDIEVLRFFIKDKAKGKRTAVQELDIKPLYIAGRTDQVKAYSKATMVFALDKFTIPDAKYLALQIMEKNGGRHLFMRITNRKLMKASILPDLK